MTVIEHCLFGVAGSMNTTADWWFGPTLQTWGRLVAVTEALLNLHSRRRLYTKN